MSVQRTCSLLGGIRVERGSHADWLALAPLHYRSHHAGAVTDVFRMVYSAHDPPLTWGASQTKASVPLLAPHVSGGSKAECAPVLVGVIVYSRAALSLAPRDRATGGRYSPAGLGRMAMGHLINEELRVISRVVVAPNWRGLGLGVRLVAETLSEVGTPYVEALAAMGQMHPLFVRAGMTAYPQPPSKEGERLRAALEAAGLDRADRRSAASLAAAIDALPPGSRDLADRQIARWARSYLAAKNHKTNRPDRQRMLDLVARHLDSAPVYYLWRSPDSWQGGMPTPPLRRHAVSPRRPSLDVRMPAEQPPQACHPCQTYAKAEGEKRPTAAASKDTLPIKETP